MTEKCNCFLIVQCTGRLNKLILGEFAEDSLNDMIKVCMKMLENMEGKEEKAINNFSFSPTIFSKQKK